jgi:hypothetical protein
MNHESFGKKCSCGHFESEHDVERKIQAIQNITQNLRYIIPPPHAIDEVFRINCKYCHCNQFNPKKKGWGFV